MKVLKFWWTSVWSTEMLKKTANIVFEAKKQNNLVVVISAMSWVTNNLIEICDIIESWNITKILESFEEIKIKHLNTAKELIWDSFANDKNFKKLEKELDNLEDILRWLALLKSIVEKSKATILYFGEILSSILLSIAINKLWINSNSYLSKNFLISHWHYLAWECDLEKSEKYIWEWLKNIDLNNEIPVITWFWWWDENGDIYLFDRWWSDYVWSLVWRLLKADDIEIWTDVNWIMSADPRVVEKPILWRELDYKVCAEFALAWAKVLHPKTISPAQEKNIPVWIKNTFNPKEYWTKIYNKDDKWIKWINVYDGEIILNFVDSTMLWACWYIYQVTKILNDEKISIDALATTEISFSITIKAKHFHKELIKKFYKIEKNVKIDIYEHITKVSFVWDSIDDWKILSYFEEEILMVTSSAYGKSLTVFVKTTDSKKLLARLHKKVFWE